MVWFYQDYVLTKILWNSSLSIPLWSDFIVADAQHKSDVRDSFQSHYGLILSGSGDLERIKGKELSIPLWSDFIIWDYINPIWNAINFQSHYGLILSNEKQHSYLIENDFQSHYGLILSFGII